MTDREAMVLRLPTPLKADLRQRAQEDKRSMTRTIELAVERYLRSEKDK